MKSWSSDIITLILRAVVCLLAALPPLHALAQADANWVRSTRMLDSTGVRRAVAVDYADGLGRPFLHVDGGVGGEGQNVYTYTRHAGLAVEAERWLPVPGPQQPAPLTRAQVAALCQGAREILGVTERRTYNPHNDLPEALHVAVAADGATAADTVATHAYDALGRLARTRRGGAAGQLEYGYEMHGWPTAIRRGGFEERLAYAEPDVGAPRYNGSVSVQRWKTPAYAQVRGYRFAYDAMGRLTAAEYGEREGLDNREHRYDEAVLAYDLNGGIERMQRRGRKQDGEYGKTDNLHIRLGGNRPVAVEDDAAPLLYEGAIDVPSTDGTPLRLAYDARGALTGDATRGVCLVEYDLPGWPRRVQFADGSVTEFVYGASGTKLRTVHLTAVPGIAVAMGERRELLPAETLAADTTDYAGAVTLRNGVPVRVDFEGGYCSIESPGSGTGTGGTGQQQIRFHYYTPDHLGNIREVVGGDGTLEQVTDYYPFGTPYYDGTGRNPSFQTRKFGGKELDLTHGYVNYDFGARGYNPLLGVWDRMDQMCEKYYDTNPYAYCINNPINFIDPFGKEPVYNRYGQYLGTTSEGFQGDILIYSGNDEINFGDMTREEVFKNYSNDIETLDMELSYAAGGIERKYLSNIWTHIASHFEGLQVYDEKFTLSSFEDKRIKFQSDNINTCWYTITPYDSSSLPSIYGTSNNIYNYESTVENIASSIIVHEWYSHVIKHVSSRIKSHRLAYKNVINFKYLWNKTTDSYKRYNLDYLRYYTNKETGRKNVDSIYQNLYKRYVGK